MFGYCLISGGRTMSEEGYALYVPNDSGQTWQQISLSNGIQAVASLLQMGGFIDHNLAFIGNKNQVFVTNDGGKTWTTALLNIPEQYHAIFLEAEMPYKRNGKLVLLMNQGDTGDYKGGNVKGEFMSADNGKTWEFIKEVAYDQTFYLLNIAIIFLLLFGCILWLNKKRKVLFLGIFLLLTQFFFLIVLPNNETFISLSPDKSNLFEIRRNKNTRKMEYNRNIYYAAPQSVANYLKKPSKKMVITYCHKHKNPCHISGMELIKLLGLTKIFVFLPMKQKIKAYSNLSTATLAS